MDFVQGFPSYPLPSHEWIHEATQVVRFHVDASVNADSKIWARREQYMRHLDKSRGNKHAFAQVRGPSNPPIRELVTHIDTDVIAVELDTTDLGQKRWELFIDSQVLPQLDLGMPVFVNNTECALLDKHADSVIVDAGESQLPHTCTLEQKQWWIQPKELAHRLNGFWNPIWQRDKNNFDLLEDFEPLQALVETLPPHQMVPINMVDVSLWSKAIAELRAGSARGIDHISAAELKLLPVEALANLVAVMDTYSEGFPTWFMIGIVRPLAKTMDVPEPSQTRPITVLSQLYRLWSKVVYLQVRHHLSSWLPPGVSGLLPRRGITDPAYESQFTIEASRSVGQPRSGFCLYLVKCFNMLKFSYGVHAMEAFGIPQSLVKQWILSLGRLFRYWLLNDSLLEAGNTYTGFPEGDTMSVLVMLTLAGFWVCMTQHLVPAAACLSISAYADNWSWSLCEPQHHPDIFTHTMVLTDIAGVSIDLRKTWFWSTRNDHAAQIADLITPVVGQRIKRVTSASDLGHNMQYSGTIQFGVTQERTDRGLNRIQRLQSMPHDLDTKSKIGCLQCVTIHVIWVRS